MITLLRYGVVCLSYLLLLSCGSQSSSEPYQWPLIEGLPEPLVPADNPMTPKKVELGRYLFYDKALSANETQSCSSCHQQANGFAESKPRSVGSTGVQLRRNANALVNIAYNKTLTWSHDQLTSIEQQVIIPMFATDPIELGITGKDAEVLARIKRAPYSDLFAEAFPGESVSYDLIVKALASFVRSLVSLGSPFDDYAYRMQDDALSESAMRGLNLFFSEKFECHHCHGGFNFTQSTSHEKQLLDLRPFHNIGLYNVNNSNQYPERDSGLMEISLDPRDNGRFRAPTLRNVTVTGPYMHDGSIATLSDVIDLYAAGGRNITTGEQSGDGRSNQLKSRFIKPIDMTEQDKIDLLAFLDTLTDPTFLSNPDFSDPFTGDNKTAQLDTEGQP